MVILTWVRVNVENPPPPTHRVKCKIWFPYRSRIMPTVVLLIECRLRFVAATRGRGEEVSGLSCGAWSLKGRGGGGARGCSGWTGGVAEDTKATRASPGGFSIPISIGVGQSMGEGGLEIVTVFRVSMHMPMLSLTCVSGRAKKPHFFTSSEAPT